MGKKPREIIIKASEKLNLPAEATAGVARVELVGHGRLSVENHRGVGAFGPECMELLTVEGAVIVRGERLMLMTMNNHELVVTGQLHSIELR